MSGFWVAMSPFTKKVKKHFLGHLLELKTLLIAQIIFFVIWPHGRSFYGRGLVSNAKWR